MLEKLSFTLYEIFGYLVPGTLVLLGLMILYWALFVPGMPLSVGSFDPNLVLWLAMGTTSYLLGHAVQAASNRFLRRIDSAANGMSDMPWMNERANSLLPRLLQPRSH